jgi:hypothetical protein
MSLTTFFDVVVVVFSISALLPRKMVATTVVYSMVATTIDLIKH